MSAKPLVSPLSLNKSCVTVTGPTTLKFAASLFVLLINAWGWPEIRFSGDINNLKWPSISRVRSGVLFIPTLLNVTLFDVPNPKLVLAVEASFKSDKLLAITNLWPMAVRISVIWAGESFNAADNSFKVFKDSGAESTIPATWEST